MTVRRRRSLLYVPASEETMVEKAGRRGADVVILDLEDGVQPTSAALVRRQARTWLLGAGSVLVVAALLACGSTVQLEPSPGALGDRPSFVLILADDMAYGLFGPGRRFPFLELPNLERLAARGVQFERAYVTTSLCSPSRASILSGLYAHAHGVRTNDANDLPEEVATFPLLLRQRGYQTAFIGKWHMDPSRDGPRPGFDYWVSFAGQGVYEDPQLNVNGASVRRSGYTTDILTDYAADWLQQRGPGPFLLILSHKAPHQPFHPAPRHAASLSGASLPEPESFRDAFRDKPEWQRRYVLCGARSDAFARCPSPLPAELPRWPWWGGHKDLDYLRTLLALDDSLGRVVSVLEARGRAENTYLLFASDNGFFLGEHRLTDKRLAYEESMRVPLVVAGGGLSHRRLDGVALNIDIAPTLLELAGVPVPAEMQGRSLVRMMRGETRHVREAFLYEYFPEAMNPVVPGILALRTSGWLYAISAGPLPDEELYELQSDPLELTNLAVRPEYDAVRRELHRQLDRLLEETGYRS